MPFLSLPSRPRRPQLLSFALALSFWAGVLVAVAPMLVGHSPAPIIGALVAAVLAVIAITSPASVPPWHRAWNRLARRVSKVAELWTLAVTYYVVVTLVGLVGSSLRSAESANGESGWLPRESLDSASYESLSAEAEGPSAQRGGLASLYRWGTTSRNAWSFVLLPFLLLLRAFSAEQKSRPLATNYTLY